MWQKVLLTLDPINAIISKGKYIDNTGHFSQAIYNSFKIIIPELISFPSVGIKDNVTRKIAAVQKRSKCLATRRRLIKNRNDMDGAFLFHLAWELDIISDFVADLKRADKVVTNPS